MDSGIWTKIKRTSLRLNQTPDYYNVSYTAEFTIFINAFEGIKKVARKHPLKSLELDKDF